MLICYAQCVDAHVETFSHHGQADQPTRMYVAPAASIAVAEEEAETPPPLPPSFSPPPPPACFAQACVYVYVLG
jgi:hypothetical protein